MPQDDEDLRRRAYAIWEREGRPEGRHAEHWERARQEGGSTARDRDAGSPSAPPPGAPRRIRAGSSPGPNAGSRATNRRKGEG